MLTAPLGQANCRGCAGGALMAQCGMDSLCCYLSRHPPQLGVEHAPCDSRPSLSQDRSATLPRARMYRRRRRCLLVSSLQGRNGTTMRRLRRLRYRTSGSFSNLWSRLEWQNLNGRVYAPHKDLLAEANTGATSTSQSSHRWPRRLPRRSSRVRIMECVII